MVDLVILLILAIALLAGYYRGVVYSAINVGFFAPRFQVLYRSGKACMK